METLTRLVQTLGYARIAALAAVGAAVLGSLLFVATRLAEPPLALLYGDLAANDAGQIVARLEAQNIPFELRAGGAQIWVPQDRALRLRMAMAEQGLPRGGSIGYEVFDQANALGATSFVQNLNLVRALEGELARTIGALGPVAAARVHLSIPRRDLFSRDRVEPTASVAVKLRDAGRLPRGQIAAIQHLVASAVPGMKPERVSIVDDRGALLARGVSDAEDPITGPNALLADERRLDLEQRLARKIEEQLERAVGAGRVRAEVALEMDFDRIVTNSETFDPDGQVVRSQQTVSESSDANESSGNQGVSVTNNLPDAEANTSQNRTRTNRQEETINYEVTKRITNHVREVGTIKRLSASIIVDGVVTQGADGRASYQPRSAEQMDQLRAAARAAVGFNERRGDTLELLNLPFSGADAPLSLAEPGWFDLSRGEILRIVELVILLIVALLVILLVARPMIGAIGRAAAPTALAGAAGPPALAAPGGDGNMTATPALAAPGSAIPGQISPIDVASIDGRMGSTTMKKVGEIIEKHPDEAVAILRSWMYQEAN